MEEETEQTNQAKKKAKQAGKIDLVKLSGLTDELAAQEDGEDFDDPDYDPHEEGKE
jgi:hypothetical protein